MILVQIDENVITSKEIIKNSKVINENISSGWVVLRSCTEFHELNRKLKPLCPELRNLDLPSTSSKIFFLKNDKSSLDKAKGQVQKYLNVSGFLNLFFFERYFNAFSSLNLKVYFRK